MYIFLTVYTSYNMYTFALCATLKECTFNEYNTFDIKSLYLYGVYCIENII